MTDAPVGYAAPSATDRLRWKFRHAWEATREFFWHQEDNLERHARRELELAGLFDKDSDYGGMLGTAVMKMMRQFSKEGHSGFSAGMAISAFQKVAKFEPLTPLTGEDSEWTEIYDGHYQNNRCSHVFKGTDGIAYDSNGKVFREPDGCCFTSRDSRVPVTFPYTPKTEYVDVERSAS